MSSSSSTPLLADAIKASRRVAKKKQPLPIPNLEDPVQESETEKILRELLEPMGNGEYIEDDFLTNIPPIIETFVRVLQTCCVLFCAIGVINSYASLNWIRVLAACILSLFAIISSLVVTRHRSQTIAIDVTFLIFWARFSASLNTQCLSSFLDQVKDCNSENSSLAQSSNWIKHSSLLIMIMFTLGSIKGVLEWIWMQIFIQEPHRSIETDSDDLAPLLDEDSPTSPTIQSSPIAQELLIPSNSQLAARMHFYMSVSLIASSCLVLLLNYFAIFDRQVFIVSVAFVASSVIQTTSYRNLSIENVGFCILGFFCAAWAASGLSGGSLVAFHGWLFMLFQVLFYKNGK